MCACAISLARCVQGELVEQIVERWIKREQGQQEQELVQEQEQEKAENPHRR